MNFKIFSFLECHMLKLSAFSHKYFRIFLAFSLSSDIDTLEYFLD